MPVPDSISAGTIRRNFGNRQFKRAIDHTYQDFFRHEYLTRAAALAYYIMLALFPLLIFLASLLAYVPIPNLFDQLTEVMARVVPADAMGVVKGVLSDILQANKELVSASILATIFTASGGFDALIGALNIAYDVKEGRPFWKRRLLAIALTIAVGLMVAIALAVMTVGPQFGDWLASRVGASPVFAVLWPYIRWASIVGFTIVSVELLYYLGPNVRQHFLAQIPGAIFAVVCWVAASFGLGLYLRSFANYNATYGVLGAVVILMLWLYLTALTILLGAELNSELLHTTGEQLPAKEDSGAAQQPKAA
jgi:membrane protein